jgi:pimeloyl-ACP methyl ester carboxylesterase
MSAASVNRIKLSYEEGGEGPPVVYIHGGFASLDHLGIESAHVIGSTVSLARR